MYTIQSSVILEPAFNSFKNSQAISAQQNHCSDKNEENAKDDFWKKLNMLQEGYIPWS